MSGILVLEDSSTERLKLGTSLALQPGSSAEAAGFQLVPDKLPAAFS
jgi:hypothetical protein